MEDAATAEISRAQVWQWVRHRAKLQDGRPVTGDLVKQTISEEVASKSGTGKFDLAAKLFGEMMTSQDFPEFLTLVAYDYID